MLAAPESIASVGSRVRMVPPPPFVTVKETVKVSPGKAPGGATRVADSAAGVWTSSGFDDTDGAETVSPEFASLPEAPKATCSVPGAVPFSTSDVEYVAVSPGAMSREGGRAPIDAAAPPVAVTTPDERATPGAGVAPVFCTETVIVPVCPRSMAKLPAGPVSEIAVTES